MIQLPDLSRFDRVAIDTETTGLGFKDRPVGLSWWTPDGQGGYAAWGHPTGNNIALSQVRDWANRELQRGGLNVVFHNAIFDLRMLRSVGIDLPPLAHDTGYMAPVANELEKSFSLGKLGKYKLGKGKDEAEMYQLAAEMFGGKPKRSAQAGNIWRLPVDAVSSYAISDAELTLGLYDHYVEKLESLNLMPVYEMERQLIPILLQMYLTGVRIDVEKARALSERVGQELEDIRNEWDRVTGGVPLSGPGSRKELLALWERLGLPFGMTENGGKSLDKNVIGSVDHPIAKLLQGARVREKLKGTFIDGYFLGHEIDGRIHPTFHPLRNDDYGTVSGRFSSSDPNFQNLFSPDKDDKENTPPEEWWGTLLRGLVIPEEGMQWVKSDYSQIEYRFFAHYAGGRMVEAYNEDPLIDFHRWCAELAGISRGRAKNGNFAKLYGSGPKNLAVTLGIPLDEAYEFIDHYDRRIPEAKRLFDGVEKKARTKGWVRTWGGRIRRFRRKRGGGFAASHAGLNALLQGSAADLMKLAMIECHRRGLFDGEHAHLHLTVHDELDSSVVKGKKGDEVIMEMIEAMTCFDLKVPIVADVETGPNWAEISAWKPGQYVEG